MGFYGALLQGAESWKLTFIFYTHMNEGDTAGPVVLKKYSTSSSFSISDKRQTALAAITQSPAKPPQSFHPFAGLNWSHPIELY